VLGKDAADHRHFGAVGGIVQELNLGLRAAAEEGPASLVGEAFGEDGGDRDLTPANARFGFGEGTRGDFERGVLCQGVAQFLGQRRGIVIHDGDGDFGGGPIGGIAEQVTEEGADHDGRDEAHGEGAAVLEEEP
jgi:hypothetical protein